MQGPQVQSLVRELDPTCMLQLRVRMPQQRSWQAATKTRSNQIKKEIKKKKKRMGFLHKRGIDPIWEKKKKSNDEGPKQGLKKGK